MEAEEEEKEKEGKKERERKKRMACRASMGIRTGRFTGAWGACFSDDVMQRQPGGLGRVEKSVLGGPLKVNMAASGPKPSL